MNEQKDEKYHYFIILKYKLSTQKYFVNDTYKTYAYLNRGDPEFEPPS